jgi:uncharacterized membrane protein YagU involved in acid resistance
MKKNVLKQALFGAIGGAAGTFVLSKVMALGSKLQSPEDQWIERELKPEPPTEALARRAAHAGLGVELSRQEKQQLGQAVHWGYGITWGAIYGIMRTQLPMTSKLAGLPFGVAFGFLGSGVLLPLFKLTPPATEFPVSSHLNGLVSHYAYTATVEGVCTGLEAIDHAVAGRRSTARLTKAEMREVA